MLRIVCYFVVKCCAFFPHIEFDFQIYSYIQISERKKSKPKYVIQNEVEAIKWS